jgi:hypothetical protein
MENVKIIGVFSMLSMCSMVEFVGSGAMSHWASSGN